MIPGEGSNCGNRRKQRVRTPVPRRQSSERGWRHVTKPRRHPARQDITNSSVSLQFEEQLYADTRRKAVNRKHKKTGAEDSFPWFEH
ncbi:hypothetical protein MTO96_025181 [Rhipicephalus appendiculatus]